MRKANKNACDLLNVWQVWFPYQGNIHREWCCSKDFFRKRSQWRNTLNPLTPLVPFLFSWWQPVCDRYVMDVSSSCGKRTVSACSTSARHLRDDHTSCGFLHLCLHAWFLLYLNNEMLRASVSVVGWSVLSLLDVTVKMQLLLLFNSVPSLLSFFLFTTILKVTVWNLHFYCLRIVQMQLFHFCNGSMTLWRAFKSYFLEINRWDDDFCTVCCSFSGCNMTFWNKTKTKQFKYLTGLFFKYLKY